MRSAVTSRQQPGLRLASCLEPPPELGARQLGAIRRDQFWAGAILGIVVGLAGALATIQIARWLP